VELRTAHREKELLEEKTKMSSDYEIKLQTHIEARQAAETMARTNTVNAMVTAALQTNVPDHLPLQTPQEDIQAYKNRIN